MKIHTQDFKDNIALLGKQQEIRITYTIDNEEIELAGEDINSITPHYKADLLKSTMKELDLDSNIDIPLETEIKFEYGLLIEGEYEYLDFGNYIVYSSEKQEDTYSYKIKCYDKMLYSMKPYENMNITYPITIKDYIIKICDYLDLNFANTEDNFTNCDKEIENELYLDNEDNDIGYTFRDVFDELAQVTGSVICINNNDEVEIRYPNETNDIIDEEYLKDINVNFGEKFGPVNTVVLSRSAGADKITLSNPVNLEENEKIAIEIADNQIMNFNNRDEFLQELLDTLYGTEYYINDYTSTGICYYDLLDIYGIQIGENIYKCLMLNDEINITQGLEELVYTNMPQNTETDYSKTDKTDRRLNQTTLIVDKQNGVIEGLVNWQSGVNNIITEVTQDINGLSTSITRAGGNNLLYYDTEFWRLSIYDILKNGLESFDTITEAQINDLLDTVVSNYEKTDNNITFIYENHIIEITELENKDAQTTELQIKTNPKIERIRSSNTMSEGEGKPETYSDIKQNTISGLGYYLNIEQVEQELELPNGVYTLSFLYKTLVPGSTTNLYINDEPPIELTETDDNFVDFKPIKEEIIDEGIQEIEEKINEAQSFDDITEEFLNEKLETTIDNYIKTDNTITFSSGETEYTITQVITLDNTEGEYAEEIQELIDEAPSFDDITENYINTELETTVSDYEKQGFSISFTIDDIRYSISLRLDISSIKTTYKHLAITVVNNILKIKFETDATRSVMIADLMLNSGNDKLDWSQNANETLTENVTIGKGIVIESTADDTKFKADTDGIRILDKETEEVTSRFTRVGTETKNLQVNNTSDLGGLIIRKISDKKVWILLG